MNAQTVAPIQPAVKTPLPPTASERVRELASIHRAVCRHCRPNGTGMVCSIGFDLDANADRLEQWENRRTRNFRLMGCPHEVSCGAAFACQALIVEVARAR